MKLFIHKIVDRSEYYLLNENESGSIGCADVTIVNHEPKKIQSDFVRPNQYRIAYLYNNKNYCVVDSVKYNQTHLLSIDVSGELSGVLGQLDDLYESLMDNQKMIEEIKEKILQLQFKKIDHE